METGISKFWKVTLFLLVETDILASGNHFFLLAWDTPATAGFIFPSSGNVFLNAYWLLETHFPASRNASFIYFLGISANDSFFSRLVETLKTSYSLEATKKVITRNTGFFSKKNKISSISHFFVFVFFEISKNLIKRIFKNV